MKQRLTCKIFGRVQGVGFRYFAKQEADKLGLSGFAQNLSDGSLLVVAEGDDDVLAKYANKLEDEAPADADISEIETDWEDAQGTFKGFSIIHG